MSVDSLRFFRPWSETLAFIFHLPPSTFHLIPNMSPFLLYPFLEKMKTTWTEKWSQRQIVTVVDVSYVVVSLTFSEKWSQCTQLCPCPFFFFFMFGCRFEGRDFLEKMRGKSIMFVGDSLSRNQWQSLTCLLHSAVPNSNYTVDRVGDVSTFTFTVWFLILIFLVYIIDFDILNPFVKQLRTNYINIVIIYFCLKQILDAIFKYLLLVLPNYN